MKHDKKKIVDDIKKKFLVFKMLSCILMIISFIVYPVLSKNPNNKFFKKLGVLFYGMIIGAFVCGLLIYIFYFKYIQKITNTTPLLRHISNIILHVIPLILVLLYAPKDSPIKPINILLFSGIFLAIYISLFDVKKIYAGVPNWLMFGLFPLVVIVSVLAKYKK